MTRNEFLVFLEDVKKARAMLNDKQAAQVINIYPTLRENLELNPRDRVRLNDVLYQWMGPETVLYTEDLSPMKNPRLWKRIRRIDE